MYSRTRSTLQSGKRARRSAVGRRGGGVGPRVTVQLAEASAGWLTQHRAAGSQQHSFSSLASRRTQQRSTPVAPIPRVQCCFVQVAALVQMPRVAVVRALLRAAMKAPACMHRAKRWPGRARCWLFGTDNYGQPLSPGTTCSRSAWVTTGGMNAAWAAQRQKTRTCRLHNTDPTSAMKVGSERSRTAGGGLARGLCSAPSGACPVAAAWTLTPTPTPAAAAEVAGARETPPWAAQRPRGRLAVAPLLEARPPALIPEARLSAAPAQARAAQQRPPPRRPQRPAARRPPAPRRCWCRCRTPQGRCTSRGGRRGSAALAGCCRLGRRGRRS